jgi:putative PIG3 family NAD(P)H quinone oxidoreductase
MPVAGDGELLVKVRAAGVNGADLNLRQGKSGAADASGRPGLEVFGTVAAIGEGCVAERSPSGTRWKVGDPVVALVAGGGYAQYVAAPVEQCLPPPKDLGANECAGIIETATTVWDNVFIRGRLTAGEVLLVQGGASGIGTTAIQLAKNRGSRVFATAGSDEKCRIAVELGAEQCFNYRSEDFVARLAALSGGANVILDVAGASYLARNLKALKVDGRLVVIALNTGSEATLDLRELLMKRASVMGSMLKTRTKEDKRKLLEQVWREVWPLYSAGKMKVVIGNVLPLAEAAKAHALMESGKAYGKTILVC